MFDFNERTELLIGAEKTALLAEKNVLLFGLGGVGGYCAEALVRAGIGHIMGVDGDTVSLSNLNRQILALRSTVGQYKTDVFRARALDINPDIDIRTVNSFYGRDGFPDNELDFSSYDYIIDCIDDVKAKVKISVKARNANVPVISCMGAGNRSCSPEFIVCDLFSTSGDPLARVLRQSLRKEGIVNDVLCVISKNSPDAPLNAFPDGRRVVSSISYSPAAEGILCASEVIRYLIK